MKTLKLAVLYFARAVGLFALARRITRGKARIICYHGIWNADDGYRGDSMFMAPRTFESRLATLARLRYPVVPLSSLIDGLRGGGPFPGGAVVLTIDDGWHSTFEHMVPSLAFRGMTATLYCDTAHLRDGLPVAHLLARHLWESASASTRTARAHDLLLDATNSNRTMAQRMESARALAGELGADIEPLLSRRVFDYMSSDELRYTLAAGIDIQLHTHSHSIHDMSLAAIECEIEMNRIVLAEILGVEPHSLVHFCYPSGVTSFRAAASLEALGVRSATTTLSGLTSMRTNPQLLPRFVDGEQVSGVEFEAEISGFSSLLRKFVAITRDS